MGWKARGMLRVAIMAFAVLVLGASLAAAERRVALVIGNSAYRHSTVLPNPAADAKAIAAALERLDFDVRLRTDLSKTAFEGELADFSERAAGADLALVYYAGHGMEMQGRNYLVPTDARLKIDLRVKFETISLEDVLSAVEGARGLKIVLLDACRDNPFLQAMTRQVATRSASRGLAKVETYPGVLVSYAAAAGTVAEDGRGRHSPYTQALLSHIETPGLELSLLFRKVADDVQRSTNGRQTPFEYGRLPGTSIYLKPQAEAEVQEEAADPCRDAAAHWKAIAGRDDAALFEDHLARFGACAFATLAELALADLRAGTGKPVFTAVGSLTQPGEEIAQVRAEAIEASVDAMPISGEETRENLGTVEMAALAPLEEEKPAALLPEEEADPRIALEDLALRQQKELDRLGCEPGTPDGKWGRRTRSAMEAFNRATDLSLETGAATPAALDVLKTRTGRVCPLVCSAVETEVNGRCVARTCAAGERLNGKGECYKPRSDTARTVRERRDTPEKARAETREPAQKAKPATRSTTAKTRTTTRNQATVTVETKPKPARKTTSHRGFMNDGCIVMAFCND